MNRRILIIIVLASIFVQVEYMVELMIYDELSHLSSIDVLLTFFTYVVYTILHFFIIFSIDIQIINRIDQRFGWDRYFVRRILLEFILTSLNAAIVTVPLTIYINVGFIVPLFNLPSDGTLIAVYYNLIYILAYNLIFVIAYESVYLFSQRKSMQLDWERAQKQNILSQFEALKNQVNPHFLFNSLNALTALIQADKNKALKFTKEFSKVLRYTLEVKENTIIQLKEELGFLSSYVYLQQIRYGKNLSIKVIIDACKLEYFVPPFSVQLLIENAIKHNVISKEKPLEISIRNDEDKILVSNKIEPRSESVPSLNIGISNLEKRYRLISSKKPTFKITDESYVATLPLINEDQLN